MDERQSAADGAARVRAGAVRRDFEYADTSRGLWVSFLFILPIMGLYEFALMASGSDLNNAVNSALKVPFRILGAKGLLWFNLMLIPAFLWVGCRHEREGGEVGMRLFLLMLGESICWGIMLSALTLLPLKMVWPNSLSPPICRLELLGIILSVGAGVYEELLFRHLLAGEVYRYLVYNRGWTGARETLAVVLVLVGSSALFSGMHYWGPYGDTLSLTSFLFRFGAGMALCIIYFTRGLGIAVYAHATYDVLLVVGLA